MPHEQRFLYVETSVLSVWDYKLTVMRLSFLSRPSGAPRQRKGQDNEKNPQNPSRVRL